VTEAAKSKASAWSKTKHSEKDSVSAKDKVETVTTGRGKRTTKPVQRGIQYNASSPLPLIPIATSTGQDTELEAQKAKFEKAMAKRARKQDAAEKRAAAASSKTHTTTEAAAAPGTAAAATAETQQHNETQETCARQISTSGKAHETHHIKMHDGASLDAGKYSTCVPPWALSFQL
jgi:hypothetical protein